MGKKSDGPSMHTRMLLGGYDRELERYGVKGPQFGRSDRGQEYRSAEDVEKDLIDAARNDYDLRRTVEAAAMSGKKKAIKLQKKGFKSIDDITNWGNFSEKAAKRHGQGGAFDSASDYMGLTRSMVERDREKQTAAYDKAYAKTTDLNDLKDKLMAEATEKAAKAEPIEPSDRMAAVEERLENAAGGGNTPPSLFDKVNANPAKTDDQKDAARSFLGQYKTDVHEAAGLKQDLETSVGNAARRVTDVYGR